jgi:hypothetical protein
MKNLSSRILPAVGFFVATAVTVLAQETKTDAEPVVL